MNRIPSRSRWKSLPTVNALQPSNFRWNDIGQLLPGMDSRTIYCIIEEHENILWICSSQISIRYESEARALGIGFATMHIMTTVLICDITLAHK